METINKINFEETYLNGNVKSSRLTKEEQAQLEEYRTELIKKRKNAIVETVQSLSFYSNRLDYLLTLKREQKAVFEWEIQHFQNKIKDLSQTYLETYKSIDNGSK
jgi:uncharacterized protein YnzC (UPF0291/DUF896 family)